MKCCKDCEIICCDFCRFYEFNGDADGNWIGKGYCTWNDEFRDPGSSCEDYICKDYNFDNKTEVHEPS